MYTYIPISAPSCVSLTPSLSHPSRWFQSTDLISLLCGCFPLARYFWFGSVYMSLPLSQFVAAYPSPSLCPQVHSLSLCLYSCPAPRFFITFFFRFHIYVLGYGICFSLSDLLHSVWQTLGPSTLVTHLDGRHRPPNFFTYAFFPYLFRKDLDIVCYGSLKDFHAK